MKKSIKMLAIMLSVLMIVSMLPAVGFASGSVSTFVGTIDFEDLTVGTTYTASSSEYVYIYEAEKVPSHSTAAFYLNKSGKTTGASIAKGGNGKAADDKYLYVKSDNTAEIWLDTTPKTFNQGDKYRFSLDYLPEKSSISSNFRPQESTGPETVFKFRQTDIIVCETPYTIPTELRSKWVHIDIILTVGNGATGTVKDTFTTYLNGEKIIDAVEWNNYCQNGKSLGRWDFVGKAQAIDNISITYYPKGTEFSVAAPKNSAATGYCNGALYVPDKTVSEVITSFGTDANVKSCKVIDANGNIVSTDAIAAGNTLLLKNINDMTYSVPMVGNTEQKTIEFSDWKVKESEKKQITDSFGADNAIEIKETITASGTATAQYTLSYGNKPHYLKIPVLTSKDMQLKIAGRIVKNGSALSGGHCLVQISDGNIYVDDGKDAQAACTTFAETYTVNEWIMLELAMFPGTSDFTVRINDGEPHKGKIGKQGEFYNDYDTNGYIELQISKGKPAVQIGAVKAYTGIPTAVTAPSLNGVPAGTTLVGNAITVPYGKDASDCINSKNITKSNVSAVKFIGADGKSIQTGYNGGKMVLISADGIYKYFTLNAREKACTLMNTDGEGNKTYWVDITKNDGSITPVIYSALFNGSLLSSVSPINIDKWEVANTTFEFTVAPHTGSTTRKIMIWDKNTLVPLAENLN